MSRALKFAKDFAVGLVIGSLLVLTVVAVNFYAGFGYGLGLLAAAGWASQAPSGSALAAGLAAVV